MYASQGKGLWKKYRSHALRFQLLTVGMLNQPREQQRTGLESRPLTFLLLQEKIMKVDAYLCYKGIQIRCAVDRSPAPEPQPRCECGNTQIRSVPHEALSVLPCLSFGAGREGALKSKSLLAGEVALGVGPGRWSLICLFFY